LAVIKDICREQNPPKRCLTDRRHYNGHAARQTSCARQRFTFAFPCSLDVL
jgi:hypothetical protein